MSAINNANSLTDNRRPWRSWFLLRSLPKRSSASFIMVHFRTTSRKILLRHFRTFLRCPYNPRRTLHNYCVWMSIGRSPDASKNRISHSAGSVGSIVKTYSRPTNEWNVCLITVKCGHAAVVKKHFPRALARIGDLTFPTSVSVMVWRTAMDLISSTTEHDIFYNSGEVSRWNPKARLQFDIAI